MASVHDIKIFLWKILPRPACTGHKLIVLLKDKASVSLACYGTIVIGLIATCCNANLKLSRHARLTSMCSLCPDINWNHGDAHVEWVRTNSNAEAHQISRCGDHHRAAAAHWSMTLSNWDFCLATTAILCETDSSCLSTCASHVLLEACTSQQYVA